MTAHAQTQTVLEWRIHLLRREPDRLPTLLLALCLAVACVWLMFGHALPALAAALLLIGATSEYLLPVTYRITTEGVAAAAPTAHFALRWRETKRCLQMPNGVLLTPLAAPSRLDAFRGVLLRYAPDGEPGDRTSVRTALAHFVPELIDHAPL